jgi:excisionase family DNA binding protein
VEISAHEDEVSMMANAATNPDDSLVRPDEAAKVLAVSKSALYRMVERGDVRAVRIGRTVRIWRSSIDELLTKPSR